MSSARSNRAARAQRTGAKEFGIDRQHVSYESLGANPDVDMADQRPRRAPTPLTAHQSSIENSHSAPKAIAVSGSPNAPSRSPQPAEANADHCSPTSAK
jgi:hypothetical protein